MVVNTRSSASGYTPVSSSKARQRGRSASPSQYESSSADEQSAAPFNPILRRQTTYRETKALLSQAYINSFLIFVPLGIIAGLVGAPAEAVFWLNWLAIVPLAPTITVAVLELADDMGQLRGGLVRAVLGNSVEMIICVVSMINGQIHLAQSIIIGSILSYSLLFLGCSYFVASLGKEFVWYDLEQAGIMSALMMVTSISLVIPTIVTLSHGDSRSLTRPDTLHLSRGTAVVLLLLLIAYLMFRFETHKGVFTVDKTNEVTAPTKRSSQLKLTQPRQGSWKRLLDLAATGCVIVCSTYMIGSLPVATKTMHATDTFIGAILLPLVGNAGKSATIIGHAYAGKIDKAIRHIMTNILDTLLFITPFLVLSGWVLGVPMQLEFGIFQAIVFTLAITVMMHVLQSGKATYFEGVMLMGTYIVIAVSFFMLR